MDEKGKNDYSIYRKVITTKDGTPQAAVMLSKYLLYRHPFNANSKSAESVRGQFWKIENSIVDAPKYELNILCGKRFGTILMLMALLYLQKNNDIPENTILVIKLSHKKVANISIGIANKWKNY